MPRVFGLLSNRDSFQRIRDAAKAEWRGMTVGPRPLHLAVCAGTSIPVRPRQLRADSGRRGGCGLAGQIDRNRSFTQREDFGPS